MFYVLVRTHDLGLVLVVAAALPAAISASTSAASPAVITAATATASEGARFPLCHGARLVYYESAAVHVEAVEHLDGFLRIVIACHLHKPKTA